MAAALAEVRAMLGVLGLDPLEPAWSTGTGGDLRSTVDGLVALALEQRARPGNGRTGRRPMRYATS